MKILKILDILSKYMITEAQRNWPFWTEHDILGFQVDYAEVSDEDLDKLNELGVFYDDSYDSLIMFT